MPAQIVAVAEPTLGRVALTVRGVPAAEAVLVLRRDSAGTQVVRDTSEATALPAAAVVGRNLFLDPQASGTTNWTTTAASKSTVSGRMRATASATTGVTVTGVSTGTSGRVPAVADGKVAARFGVYGHTTKTLYARLTLTAFDAGGSSLGVVAQSAWVTIGPVAVVAVELFGTAPASTATITAVVAVAGDNTGGPVVVGDWLEFDNVRVDTGPTAVALAGLYPGMSGATTDGTGTPTSDYAWTGAADASTSEQTSQVLVVYDYEARQGEETDYLATDTDGVVLATAARITVPVWGTWLKSIGRPYLNTRCYFGGEAPPNLPARRQLVAIEGSATPVALSELRMAARGQVRIVTLTAAQESALLAIVAPGDVLMLDTNASWRSPYRYISVGDVSPARGAGDGELGLDREQRTWVLSDVAAVAAPIGVSQVNDDASYDELPVLYGSYAALAATVPTYDDLVL